MYAGRVGPEVGDCLYCVYGFKKDETVDVMKRCGNQQMKTKKRTEAILRAI
jgi:hypothetical protein